MKKLQFVAAVVVLLLVLVLGMGFAEAPAYAQSVYPTALGRVTAPATVPLQCNASNAACAPVTAANPLRVSAANTGAAADQVQGNVAQATTDAGNPIKIGGRVNGGTTWATLTDGQRADALSNANGMLYVSAGQGGSGGGSDARPLIGFTGRTGWASNPDPVAMAAFGFNGSTWDRTRGDSNGLVTQPALSATYWQYAAVTGGIVNSTADVAVKAAAGASVRNYVCAIDITHDVLGAATEIVVKDGTTVMWRGKLQTAATDTALGAGDIAFSPCLRGTANTAVNVAAVSAVTGGIYVNLRGYTGS
ncbi:hypothetical protein [Novosphingobium huizhouense]|uniref:hypothetical protein n=1 Tax=Novosphingobium huizhouense TaxID=2866625 RepID=UPI001CD86DAC|nr:hypothetical protein [Novosphingobium huizhouense]